MAKSRNRSRDARKRAAKKRKNRDYQTHKLMGLAEPKFKFDTTHCSQCGGEFGPGNSGYSHCIDHKGIPEKYED